MIGVQKADRGARGQAVAIALAILLLGSVTIMYIDGNQFGIANWLLENLAIFFDRPGMIVAGAFAIFAPFLAFAVHIFLFGRRVVVAQRFPPPGHKVIRDTLIVEGRAAVRRGRLLQSIAVVLIFSVEVAIIVMVYLAYELTSAI